MDRAFVGRQPIYGDGMQFFAYELLHRNSELNQAAFANGDQATAQVLLNTFLEIGLDRVVGDNLAFVNVTRNFLLGDYCSWLPRERVVIELLEDIVPDSAVLQAISRLSKAGYQIALDDFIYSERLDPLLRLADIVKVDIRALDADDIPRQVESLRHFGVKLLAEKVETQAEYQFCQELGFDYYQGYFFCRPQVLSEQQIPFNRMAALRLVAKLQDPQISRADVEETVSQDLAISYRVLRFVNSTITGVSRRIESIRHAVALVGTRRICDWASIMLFGNMEDKPRELMITAIVRARMCEQLCQAMKQPNGDQFFTVGLFSVLDALLDRPMCEALELLPLAEDVKNALVGHLGLMGTVLHCVETYERGEWDLVRCGNLDQQVIRDAYLTAVEWTRSMTRELSI